MQTKAAVTCPFDETPDGDCMRDILTSMAQHTHTYTHVFFKINKESDVTLNSHVRIAQWRRNLVKMHDAAVFQSFHSNMTRKKEMSHAYIMHM